MAADLGDLEHRQARLGEPTIGGNRWWPNEADRLVSLYQAGATLASGERAAAERELEARERRAATPPVLRREDVTFEPSSFKGVDIGYIVSPHLGIEVRNIVLEVHRIRPGAHTEACRANESVVHVLNGRGWTEIDGTRYEWGPHDSIHIQKGAWFQHANLDESRPAHLLVGRASPILEHLSPYADVFKGDSYSDQPDGFRPEHPFTRERVDVGFVDGQKWMSKLQMATHHRREERERLRREARVVLRADEAVIERSEHRGDWKVGLVDRYLGFDNRILAMYVHQMPPASHTETHKHGEAIVYVLSGNGYSIVEGDRFDWRAGDCIFVKPGQWHQHFNTNEERVSQHLALYIQPLKEQVYEAAELVELRTEDGYDPAPYTASARAWWEDGLG
jgi:quercetin dioxygenase-like cupin family protein